jgi:hypothetical protein
MKKKNSRFTGRSFCSHNKLHQRKQASSSNRNVTGLNNVRLEVLYICNAKSILS